MTTSDNSNHEGLTWQKFCANAVDVTIDIALEATCLLQDLGEVSRDLAARGRRDWGTLRSGYGKVRSWFCQRYPR